MYIYIQVYAHTKEKQMILKDIKIVNLIHIKENYTIYIIYTDCPRAKRLTTLYLHVFEKRGTLILMELMAGV